MRKDKIIIYLFLMLIVTACKTSKYTESRDLLKEYAFCKCLEYGSNDSTLFKDISKSIYRDIAQYDLNVYEIIDSISFIKASQIKPSIIADHEGKKPILLNCFKYYHSSQLDSLIKKMDDKIIKSW